MSLIISKDLRKTYINGEIKLNALKVLSFEIQPATFVSFTGPSGSGKTTLLNLIGCLDKPTSGMLSVAGEDVTLLDKRKAAFFRGKNIGFIFQDFNLIPVLTVYENVEYPLLMLIKVSAANHKKVLWSFLNLLV